MTSIDKWLKSTVTSLTESGIKSARLDAELLLCFAETISREFIAGHPEHEFDPANVDTLVGRRLKGEPLAYIMGRREFYGRQFIVTPDVLIPRPETETLVSMVLSSINNPSGKMLDMGCGSGCIGITLKLERPELDVTLADISPDALGIARKNWGSLSTPDMAGMNFIESDLFSNIIGRFDVITANLPYIDPSWDVSPEIKFEPDLALYADNHGVGIIKEFLDYAPRYMNPSGLLVIELDSRQMPEIKKYATDSGFQITDEQPFTLSLKLA